MTFSPFATDTNRKEVELFIEEANNFHPTIKFTAEISEIAFLDTIVFKGERLSEKSILDIKITETFQYTHFTSYHPPGVIIKRGFIKGETVRLL